MSRTHEPRRVVVVGGGISGLTAAYRLVTTEEPLDVTVLDADARVGGKLRSVEVGGLSLEAGADSFVARKPWAVELCKELGLGGELVTPGASAAYLWTGGGLVPYLKDSAFGIPGDIGDVLRWPGLSRGGRMRAAQDLVRRARKDRSDESLGSLLRRRLGDEATDRSVAPLLAGLFSGDVDRLSVQATFPELADWERDQGSLVRGSQAARRRAREAEPGPMFVKLEGGTSRLTDALADAIGRDRVILGDAATAVEPRRGGYVVRTEAGSLTAHAVVLGGSAFESARLVRSLAPEAAAELDGIPYASTAVIFLVYPEGTMGALPEGTGFVVPRGKAPMTASTWVSNKWPRAEFGTRAVVRCFVGGVGDEDVVDQPDEELVAACERHLAAVVELPERAQASEVVRWRRGSPQYEVGHLDRVERLRETLPPGVFTTGSAYHGVGIPDCVRDATETAGAVREHLAGHATDREQETVR